MSNVVMINNADLYGAIVETLEAGYQTSVVITGMSMWPFLCHGRDRVVLCKISEDELKVGDIILFNVKAYNKYIIHRIIKLDKQKRLMMTAGDGNPFIDGWYPIDCVIAKVDFLIRKGKKISVESKKYQLLADFWRLCFPVRALLLKLLVRVSCLKTKIKSRV